MRTESKLWVVVTPVMLLGLLLIGNAAAQTQHAGATTNAEIVAAETWAFPTFPPLAVLRAPPQHPQQRVRVTGSARSYTQAQLAKTSPDWFPQDHPLAPAIVAIGREPAAMRCAECHLINGTGVPATASLMGLPKGYILEQFAAFRAGQRGASAPRTTQDMANEVRAVNDADLQLAADYFSGMKFVSRIKVIETATVPKMHWTLFVQVPDKGGAREPIGPRIIETPANFDDYQYGNNRTTYIAYVPPGSIARGAVLAEKGRGKVAACESCHGTSLQGVGVIPPLAGRSPTYIVRELILFRTGQRSIPQAVPMVQEASQLTVNDMIAVAAYAASRK